MDKPELDTTKLDKTKLGKVQARQNPGRTKKNQVEQEKLKAQSTPIIRDATKVGDDETSRHRTKARVNGR